MNRIMNYTTKNNTNNNNKNNKNTMEDNDMQIVMNEVCNRCTVGDIVRIDNRHLGLVTDVVKSANNINEDTITYYSLDIVNEFSDTCYTKDLSEFTSVKVLANIRSARIELQARLCNSEPTVLGGDNNYVSSEYLGSLCMNSKGEFLFILEITSVYIEVLNISSGTVYKHLFKKIGDIYLIAPYKLYKLHLE